MGSVSAFLGELVEQALKTVRLARLYNRRGELASLAYPGQGDIRFDGRYAEYHRILTCTPCGISPVLTSAYVPILLDALANIDYVQVIGQSMDVPDALQSQVAVAQTLRYTTKPILVYPYDRAGLTGYYRPCTGSGGQRGGFPRKAFSCLRFCASRASLRLGLQPGTAPDQRRLRDPVCCITPLLR